MLCFQSNPERCTPSCRVDVIESVYDVARRASEEGGGPLLEALKKASQTPSDTEPHHLTIGCVSTTIDLPRASPPAVSLVTGVLLPNLIWRPGQANTRIRKASLLALHTTLPAIEPNWMRSILDELVRPVLAPWSCRRRQIPLLKSSLDDAFTPDNRHLATTVIIDIFGKMADDQQLDEFDAEVLRESYPDLLKRLDDSVDEIRILACRALGALMEVLSSRPGTMKALSNSVFGYIIRALFVHLDDSNMQLSKAVYAALRRASAAGGSAFGAEVDTAAANSLQPDLCLSLLNRGLSSS
ncbi:HEAT repeat-containing protein 2 [Perkinsus olseni]|uniref:HEAT repeat-containing protein 2 n=1 Tax=Perkinsus olseni TaxID=32597 RepID=A0A7J6SQX9_PEROL|nr:HEAT repeat-containing protein 2 [Perkinsus olseni]